MAIQCCPIIPIIGAPHRPVTLEIHHKKTQVKAKIVWEKKAKTFVEFYSVLLLPFGPDLDPRDPTMPNVQILPWNPTTSWSNFTKVIRSWDVDTDGRNDNTGWYKRSLYRLFNNLVSNLCQPKKNHDNYYRNGELL